VRVHVLGLAHNPINLDGVRDAFTMKVYNLCRMLRNVGHTVVLYGAAGTDTSICDEFVECVSADTYRKLYGDADKVKAIFDSGNGWAGDDAAWLEFRFRCAMELGRRVGDKANEPILLSIGWCHAPMLESLRGLGQCQSAKIIEAGIGYDKTYAPTRVFESYAWQHYRWAADKEPQTCPGRQDVVIPNYYDPDHFEFSAEKDDYFLFMARIVPSKGYLAALEACKKAKVRLKVVGQLPRDAKQAAEALKAIKDAGGEYGESVGFEERKQLLARARALFCLTTYVGPFEGVAVEAMISGTPVIATDRGALTETVPHGLTGWRCHTNGDIAQAIKRIGEIDPKVCRAWALCRYSMDVIQHKYDALLRLVVSGENPGLDWRKEWPACKEGLIHAAGRLAHVDGIEHTQNLAGSSLGGAECVTETE
jgi:glycosyltransferase involved in cell wall biosynthesis